ncbi:hypothetical protein HHK36_011979 [Tetracentron sinense]|uniref:60S ribosomal protein L6 n=1 Tax=Tetracentron sinense TaxID=13715 RepID=A0A835DHQ4_TETSI|nr:hypothetical protein HHK36_011979 [Tetracentron sinense]
MAPTRKLRVCRNPDQIRSVGKYSRSKMYHKRGLWAIKAKNGGVFPQHDPKLEASKPAEKPPKFYPADDVKKPFDQQAQAQNPPSSGPKINGVPLRRVIQSYVIATSTKVDISEINVENFDDKYFTKEAGKKKNKGEGDFFEAEKEKSLPQEKNDDQKAVDSTLIKSIEGVTDLRTYLAARFSLRSGLKPHELVF